MKKSIETHSIRKDAGLIKIYLVQDLWDAEAVESTRFVPVLTEDDLWSTNQIKLTQAVLVDKVRKINDVDISYPITLFADGRVADGIHRILYASVNNITSIKVRQLVVDPQYLQEVSETDYLSRFA